MVTLSYCLEIDRDGTATFEPLVGCEEDSLVLSHSVAGLTTASSYGFRYKVRNEYGWGDYSETASLLVATEPATPATAPSFVSATDTDLTVEMNISSVENNGSPILEFSLEVSDGDSDYAVVSTYEGLLPSHTLNDVNDALVAGTLY
jgi:hypothetical protein